MSRTKKGLLLGRGESKVVEIPRYASTSEIEELTDRLGFSEGYVKKIISFTDEIEELAVESRLQPPQIISACMHLVAGVIRTAYKEGDHPDICTDLFHQLWESCDLPSDTHVEKN